MKTFYFEPVTAAMIAEKLTCEVGEEILHWERVSSLHRKHPYGIRNEVDAKYLERAKKIISDVGDFISDCLPRFPYNLKGNFDYVRTRNVEFLDRYELRLTVKAETAKEQKELCLCFDLPSFVLVPKILHGIRGHYLYLYNHLESRVSFVIGNVDNPKTQDCFIDDAMEEFWHLALYPHLVERLNRDLQSGTMQPSDNNVSRILLVDGELMSKAFALASFEEFEQKKGYNLRKREARGKERVIVNKIKRVGIRKGLREVGKVGGF